MVISLISIYLSSPFDFANEDAAVSEIDPTDFVAVHKLEPVHDVFGDGGPSACSANRKRSFGDEVYIVHVDLHDGLLPSFQ